MPTAPLKLLLFQLQLVELILLLHPHRAVPYLPHRLPQQAADLHHHLLRQQAAELRLRPRRQRTELRRHLQ
jgi:hypothetical protein